MIVYHVIKESDLGIAILPSNLAIFKQRKGFENFEGTTHEDYKSFGDVNHKILMPNASFGSIKTKGGVSYWILGDFPNDALEPNREIDGEVISQSLTHSELIAFGWDVEEFDVI